MMKSRISAIVRRLVAGLALAAASAPPAAAQDKVTVGVFPVSSSLPYFVALERGFFKEQNIEPEMTKLMGGPPNVAAMITNQIEVSAVLVTLEGLNANIKKPGVAMYIALNSQTKVWKMEQFVVRNGFKADNHRRSQGRQAACRRRGRPTSTPPRRHSRQERPEGRRLHHRPARHGPARQRHDRRHLRRRLYARAQRLDHAQGRRRHHARGRRDRQVHPRRPDANAYAAGCAMTTDFIKRPDVAKRFAAAWGKAIDFINKNPDEARKYLAKNTFTPDDVVDMVPMLGYIMASDMTPKDSADYQKFIDSR